MQRVLIVHNHYRIPGGEDVVAENEEKLLKSHGHELFRYERDNGEPVGRLCMFLSMFFSLRTYREIRQLIREKKIDIVHVHNTLFLISPSVFYAAVKEEVPVVQTLHNFRLRCAAGTFFRNGRVCEDCVEKCGCCALKGRCYRGSLLQTAAVLLMNAVHRLSGIWEKVNFIYLTEFDREKLKGLPCKRSFIKPNFCFAPGDDRAAAGEETAAAVSACASAAKGKGTEEPYYFVLGRIEHLKGSALIAKAFAKNGRRLIFAGSGEQLPALKRFIERKGIKNIETAGQLSHEKAMELLAGARALIAAPQWYETFGMGVIEAYSLGVPVIAADFGNVGALVKDGVTGVKFQNSSAGLYRAVERFEKAERGRLSENARREYEEKYSPEVNYHMLKKIYDEMTGEGS